MTLRPNGIRRVAGRVLALAAAGACVVVSSAAPATAQDGPSTASSTAAPSTSPASGSQAGDDQSFVRLEIDSITPSGAALPAAGTADEQSAQLTVHGTLRNVGDRGVDNLMVRFQRAPAVADTTGLQTMLNADQAQYDVVSAFTEVDDRLDEGESTEFTLSVPLFPTAGAASLGVTEPGVYPVLLNVNGTPDYGGPARLDDVRTAIPVAAAGSTPAHQSVPTTMLWPLAAAPAFAGGLTGAMNNPARLINDDLADDLADGGRLQVLLGAAESMPDAVRRSTCLAIDPELVATVRAMSTGYLVVDAPADPAGDAHPGSGAPAAAAWLERLRRLVADTCTIALPRAQVDLDAVTALGNESLTAAALSGAADELDATLGVTTDRTVVWPDAGSISDPTTGLLADAGARAVLVASNTLEAPATGATAARSPNPAVALGPLTGLSFDAATATVLANTGGAPSIPAFAPPTATTFAARDDAPAAARQAAVAALVLPVATAPTRAQAPAGAPQRIIVPPQRWAPSADDAAAVVQTLAQQFDAGTATPRSIGDVLNRPEAPTAGASAPSPSGRTPADGPPSHLRAAVADQLPRIDALADALVDDPSAPLSPRQFLGPLRDDLVRALTRDQRADAAATTRVNKVAETMDRLFDSVSVVAPGGVYTLASGQSPLLLVARNDLPVGVRALLGVSAPEQITVNEPGEITLPPRGSRSITVPAHIDDSLKLVVQFSLTTPGGQRFAEPTSVTVRSNAYGKALAIITAGAGALLLLLAGRRLYHRFTGRPDPADLAEPTELDPETLRPEADR